MTHMKLTRDVGRRNRDGAVTYAFATLVITAIEPFLQNLRLVHTRVVVLGHLFHMALPFSSEKRDVST